MGSDLVEAFPVARDLYAKASEVVGYDMTELSFRDPREQLNLTRFTQPALLTHEVGSLPKPGWRSYLAECFSDRGHSLGFCAGFRFRKPGYRLHRD